MELQDLGEFGLIARIRAAALRSQGRAPVLGIGDDAALIRPRARHDVAISCDAFVEGVHFDFDHESPFIAGRRALAAALSDLAAMGATPIGLTLSLSAPPRAEVARVMGLVRGLLADGARYGSPLLGGNVARSSSLELHLSVLGEVPRGRALRRSGARPGDRLFVSGPLGRSALQRKRGRVTHVPEPRLVLGRSLLRTNRASACIDISDGLLADLGHLCEASGVGARIDVGALPRPRGFAAACRRAGVDAGELLLTGGEDCELLFTARAAPLARQSAPGACPTEIGIVTEAGLELLGGPGRRPPRPGWRHF